MEIKPATPDDIEWLLGELKDFSQFYGTKRSLFPEDMEVATDFVKRLITQFCLVAWRGNIRLGFISGFLIPHPYNPGIRVLHETFWWVKPEHRKSGAGLLLLDAFTDYGVENADWIFFVLEHHSPVHDDCLIQRGFKLNEKSYIREV